MSLLFYFIVFYLSSTCFGLTCPSSGGDKGITNRTVLLSVGDELVYSEWVGDLFCSSCAGVFCFRFRAVLSCNVHVVAGLFSGVPCFLFFHWCTRSCVAMPSIIIIIHSSFSSELVYQRRLYSVCIKKGGTLETQRDLVALRYFHAS